MANVTSTESTEGRGLHGAQEWSGAENRKKIDRRAGHSCILATTGGSAPQAKLLKNYTRFICGERQKVMHCCTITIHSFVNVKEITEQNNA